MAGAAGFEPANGGTKSRCLTTWPRPSMVALAATGLPYRPGRARAASGSRTSLIRFFGRPVTLIMVMQQTFQTNARNL